MGGGCKSGQSAVARQEKVLELTRIDRPFPDLQQSAGHIPDHVMKETVSFDSEQQSTAPFL